MSNEKHALRRPLALLLASSLCAAVALPVVAAEPDAAAAQAGGPAPSEPSAPSELPPAPSQNVTINLINRLVQRHVLTKEDASELIKQAEEDAATARAQAMAAQSAAAPPPITDDTVRVTYIPETVKAQMRDEIKQEVMDQARDENWAAPRTLPDWVTRFKLLGDVRFRGEGDWFPSGNLTGPGSNFWNYSAINASSTPYDYTGLANPPYPNASADRFRLRLRARFGVEADLGSGFTAGLRIGTGENSSPVTQNQTLGNNGGDFSKYALWLDRGFIKYELGERNRSFSAVVGRFDNPFVTTRMFWNDDVGFDGAALQGKYEVAEGVTPFLTGGIFPVFNTDFNFATNSSVKFSSRDKWLEAIQGGLEWKINKDFTAKVAAGYFYFQNVEGVVSDPFVPLTATDAGNTDSSRPSFAQKGNTYIALRDITPDVSNNYGAINQWQYFGLATPFHDLALNARLDYNHFESCHVWVQGEIIKNLAFDRTAILNNGPSRLRGPVNNLGTNGVFGGGDTAWMLTLNVGKPALEATWDWSLSLGYRYVESDALIDGFCDSDFGGGGTNLKGFILGGSLALSPRVWLGFRWMSADSIGGVPYKEDVLQIDFNAKF